MGQLSEADRAEIERSAKQAAQITVAPPDRDQVERYLNPPPTTAFPLEYAFWLLGDIQGKTVLDIGCGSGENIIPLAQRGACVVALDISPQLIALARQRLVLADVQAAVRVASAYETGLPDASVDVIFCIGLVHHLDIERVRGEMRRVLAKDGKIILKEPICFSPSYARLRKFLPHRDDASEYEHPLTRDEFAAIQGSLRPNGTRYFRLPFVPLLSPIIGARPLRNIDRWFLQRFPTASRYATSVVTKLEA